MRGAGGKEEMGAVFNEYVASVFTKEGDLLDDEPGEVCVDSLGHDETKKEAILGFLRSAKLDESTRPDGKHP